MGNPLVIYGVKAPTFGVGYAGLHPVLLTWKEENAYNTVLQAISLVLGWVLIRRIVII